jgi:hypothetical protein
VHSKWFVRLSLIMIVVGMITVLPLIGCKISPPAEANPPAETNPPAEPVPPANQEPVIHYISAEHEVTPLNEIQIRCVATDADKDTLTYVWSTSGGTITGEGSDITWTAPEETGDYVITAAVTDSNGAETTDSVTIAVTPAPNHVPVLTLTITIYGKDPVTVTPSTDPIALKKNSSAEIVCTAEDPDGDEISFRWSATEGRIDGEGSTVTYYSTESGDIAITVTAIDSQGGQVKSSVYLHIPCCGSV